MQAVRQRDYFYFCIFGYNELVFNNEIRLNFSADYFMVLLWESAAELATHN